MPGGGSRSNLQITDDPNVYCTPQSPVIDPESLDFGETLVGEVSGIEPVTVQNNVRADLSVDRVDIIGQNVSSFRKSGDDCSGEVLAFGESCELRLTFVPRDEGPASATLRVTSNAFDSPTRVPLSGTGTVLAAPAVESIDPEQGARGETLPVTINGSGFADGARAVLARGSIRLGIEDASVGGSGNEVSGDLSIPEGLALGDYDIEVRNPDGQRGSLEGAFTVAALPAPEATSASPASGGRGETVDLTIEGSDFRDGALAVLAGEVRLRASSTSLEPSGDLTARFSIPPNMPTGSYDLEVRNPDGQETSLANAFEVTTGGGGDDGGDGGDGGGNGTDPPPDPAASTTTLNASSRLVNFGQSVTLSGRLADESGSALSGKRLVLERRFLNQQRFQQIGTRTTNNNGRFAARVSAPRNAVYRARFTGDEENRASQRAVRVNVRAAVNLNLSRDSAIPGQNVVIAGNVRPAKTSFVNLTIRRGGQVVVNRRVNLNEQSRYRFVYQVPARGNHLVQVRYAGDRQNLAGAASERFQAVAASRGSNQTSAQQSRTQVQIPQRNQTRSHQSNQTIRGR